MNQNLDPNRHLGSNPHYFSLSEATFPQESALVDEDGEDTEAKEDDSDDFCFSFIDLAFIFSVS